MKFIDHLTKEQIMNFNQIRRTMREEKESILESNPYKKRAEKLSQSGLKELMGINRDIFKRVNGAVRRK